MPTAFEIEMMNEQELETEEVCIKNSTFAKPHPMSRTLIRQSTRTGISIFVVDPSTYDQVVEPNVEIGNGPSLSSLLAAERDFDVLCRSDDGDVRLIMLVFVCDDSFRAKLATRPFRFYYPGYVGDGAYPSVKRFLLERFVARCCSSHSIIPTGFVEEGDDQGVQLMTTNMMRQIELHYETMGVHV